MRKSASPPSPRSYSREPREPVRCFCCSRWLKSTNSESKQGKSWFTSCSFSRLIGDACASPLHTNKKTSYRTSVTLHATQISHYDHSFVSIHHSLLSRENCLLHVDNMSPLKLDQSLSSFTPSGSRFWKKCLFLVSVSACRGTSRTFSLHACFCYSLSPLSFLLECSTAMKKATTAERTGVLRNKRKKKKLSRATCSK